MEDTDQNLSTSGVDQIRKHSSRFEEMAQRLKDWVNDLNTNLIFDRFGRRIWCKSQ